MPRATQIIPEHQYPHQMVVINDNTEISATVSSESGDTSMLFVFASPKGRGNMQTITGGASAFLEEYGLGSFSLYGQPLLNAYAAASSGAATLQCLRVAADDAAYAVDNLVLKYKVDENGIMQVKLTSEPAGLPLTDLDKIDDCYTAPTTPDDEGYMSKKLLSVAYLGKGAYGDNIRYRIVSDTATDKENNFKNYILEVYINDGGLVNKESFNVCFFEDAIYSGMTLFADSVITDQDTGSKLITIKTYTEAFQELYSAYKTAVPDTILTLNDWDPILGIDKYTKNAMKNYVIDTMSDGVIVPNTLQGVPLHGGDDGLLNPNAVYPIGEGQPKNRQDVLNALYLKAYGGQIDEYIKSKNRYPVNIILDANFDVPTKKQIAALAIARTDCVAILDCGTTIATKQSPLTYVNANLGDVVNRVQDIEAYAGKVTDPYSGKPVVVTGTYWMASAFPTHFQTYEGKHVPLAGNNYGKLSGFLKNSVYPIYDEDIDTHKDLMDQMNDARINYVKLNANGDLVRATQNTRQERATKLSELSNVMILLDIKRDCEKICTKFEFNFSEPADIARFNAIAKDTLGFYANAQVRRIAASFNKNDWEAERGILHMYVDFVHKDLVKTSIIEIDVNKE